MRLNAPAKHQKFTAEGGPAWPHTTALQQLRRSVMSCLLWEKEFYEDGQSIADRIVTAAMAVPPEQLAGVTIEARQKHHLRHVPLLLLTVLARTGAGKPGLVANTVERVISRADELTELLAIYWRDGRKPLPNQFKKGLARAFVKFDEYALAKYNRDNSVKLRDVLFLSHAKPESEMQAALWKKLVDKTLEPPDTWEVQLSAGADKRETFTRLLADGHLGYMALLRNLRNMVQSEVDLDLVRSAIVARKGARQVLPFRFIAAARACPQLEPELDTALKATIYEMPEMVGMTALVVDVSSSMNAPLSGKSDLTRMDAAAALASIWPGHCRLFSFSGQLVEVPPRKGMSGIDAIIKSQYHNGTHLANSLATLHAQAMKSYDRIVVITDEQTHDGIIEPLAKNAYLINVASNANGVGYGRWTHIDGFSESVLKFIAEFESTLGKDD